MNIHFTDKELFEKLKSATIAKVVVGSHMYKSNNESSDTDYLYIYATSENELNSFIKTHHQLQYKEDNIDYNFVSLHNFLYNTLNGDSTINFEVINSDALIGTDIEFLNDNKDAFLTYTIIRSYLGLCRRDIKCFFSSKNDYERSKRLKHVIRGSLYAKYMIDKNFDFDKTNDEFRAVELDITTAKQLKYYEAIVSGLRNTLTEKFNAKTLGLAQNMDVAKGILITNKVLEFCKSKSFKDKQAFLSDFSLEMFINSNENWVEY